MSKKRKVIIQAAITGSVHTPSMSPFLPITPEQISDEIIRCYEAGAASVHIHARNPETGEPSSDLNLFGQILTKVKSKCNIICGVTSGGGAKMTVEERIAIVPEYEPELASYDVGSMNFAIYPLAKSIKEYKHDWEEKYILGTEDYVFRNTFKDLKFFAEKMNMHKTKPELEIFDTTWLSNTEQLIREGYLQKPLYIQFVLGILGGAPASVEVLVFLLQQAKRMFSDDFVWSACFASREQYALLASALALGGNVRVGMEDSLYVERGVLAKSNAEQVEKAVRIVRELGYEIATPDEAREILGLKGLGEVKY